jgi:hypothetical protein
LFIRFIIGFAIGAIAPSASSTTLPFSALAFTLITDLSYTRMDSPVSLTLNSILIIKIAWISN